MAAHAPLTLLFVALAGLLAVPAALAEPDDAARNDADEARAAADEARAAAQRAQATAEDALQTAVEARELAREAAHQANLSRIEFTRLSADIESPPSPDRTVTVALIAAGTAAVALAAFRLTH